MSWRDQDWSEPQEPWPRVGGPGGDWQGLRPTFENPLSWSLPVLRLGGIGVRVHLVFLLFIAVMLLRSIAPPDAEEATTNLGLWLMAAGLACLFVIVLTHELGHCLACRWTGGEASEILMWPLGGLAFCRPRRRWSHHLATALGGPAVNLLLCAVAGTLLGLQTGRWLGVALPNPLQLDAAIRDYELNRSWPLAVLFLVNWCSLVVLLFNLLPMFPLDGGRIVHAALWARMGYVPAMRTAVRIGYLGAIGLGLGGAVLGHWMLLAIAAFGAVTCWMTHRQLEFTEAVMADGPDWGREEAEQEGREGAPSAADRRARRRSEREAAEDREVDRILAKISTEGLESLSRPERRLLRRVTERRKDA